MSQKSLEGISSDPNEDNTENKDQPMPDNPQKIMQMLYSEEIFESPIDINIGKVTPINAVTILNWMNYELPPKKMKITNTGHTVILSGKWGQERPYITNGILEGKYVFSQMHLHWGINDMEGSEHTIDGCQMPGEMHVVTFKSCYLTQESALKETDGVAILVYIFKLQDPPNPGFQIIIDALPSIAKAHTSVKIAPVPLGFLMRQFDSDYFMYRGSVSTTSCIHYITWLITRIPIGVSPDQIDSLRFLLDNDDELIKRNFRPVQPIKSRNIFHVLPSPSKYATLHPIPDLDIGEKPITQIYRIQLFYDMNIINEQIKNFNTRWSSRSRRRYLRRKINEFLQPGDIYQMPVLKYIIKYIKGMYYIVFY